MSVPPPSAAPRFRWPALSRRTWLVVALAFGAGLLLFVLLWLGERGDDFYRAGPQPENVEGRAFEPLPVPLPARTGRDDDGASGMPPAEPDRVPPRVVEQAAPPPETTPAPPGQPAPASASGVALAPGDTPVPISSPAPRYPPQALRRRESGTVLLRVHVGADGAPYAVDLVESSHSRQLDRAASDAVRRWRFLPAQRDGRPVPGVVQVPIAFDAKQ